MASYREERFNLRGIETVVHIAGEGDPLVFLHGAGTVTGFDALLPLAERFKLVVPFHPGFGRKVLSADVHADKSAGRRGDAGHLKIGAGRLDHRDEARVAYRQMALNFEFSDKKP